MMIELQNVRTEQQTLYDMNADLDKSLRHDSISDDSSLSVQIQLIKLQHDTDIIKYKKQIARLQHELYHSKQSIDDRRKNNKHSTNNTVRSLQQQIVELSDINELYHTEHTELKLQFNRLQHKYDELVTQNMLSCSMVQQHTNTIQQRDTQICILNDEVQQLQHGIQSVEHSMMSQTQTNHNDTQQLHRHNELLKQQLHEQNIEHNTIKTQLQTQNDQLHSDKLLLHQQIDVLHNEHKQLLNDSKQYNILLPDHKQSIDKLHTIELEYARLQGTHDTVIQQLTTVTNKLTTIESQQYDHIQHVQSITHKLASLETENKLLCDTKRQLEHSNKRTLQSLDTLSRQVQELTGERQKLVLERDDNASSLQHLQHQLSALREENEALELQLSQLRAETIQTSEIHTSYEQKLAVYQSDIQSLNNQLSAVQQQYNSATKQLKQLEHEHTIQLNDMQTQLNSQAQHNIEHQRKQKSIQLQLQSQNSLITPKNIIIEQPLQHISALSNSTTPNKQSPRRQHIPHHALPRHVHTMSQSSTLNLSEAHLQAELVETEILDENLNYNNDKHIDSIDEHKPSDHVIDAHTSLQMPAHLELQLNHLMNGLHVLRDSTNQQPEHNRRKRSCKNKSNNKQSKRNNDVPSIQQFQQENNRIAAGLHVCIVRHVQMIIDSFTNIDSVEFPCDRPCWKV